MTTFAKLNELNRLGIDFITLRPRAPGLVRMIDQTPPSAWRQIELKGVSRPYTHPRILDHRTALSGYEGAVRQVIVADLGHEEPTILLTNQLTRTAARLVERYAQRMIIENTHRGWDRLLSHGCVESSAVAMKVNCDLQLTLMASSLYRLLAGRIGRGYEHAESRHLFLRLRRCHGGRDDQRVGRLWCGIRSVLITPCSSRPVSIRRRQSIPWLGRKRLRLVFG